MRVIIVMKADGRMVDLAKMIQLVEAAFKQLVVHQESADAVSVWTICRAKSPH